MDKLNIKQVAVGTLRPHPDNPRTISAERFAELVASVRSDPSMLEVRPLIALPSGEVIAGCMRLQAAKEAGLKKVPCVTVDLDDDRAREWALRDNSSWGEWDQRRLADILDELRDQDVDLALTGLSKHELADNLALIDGWDHRDDEEPERERGQYAEVALLVGSFMSMVHPDRFLAWESKMQLEIGFHHDEIMSEILRRLEIRG